MGWFSGVSGSISSFWKPNLGWYSGLGVWFLWGAANCRRRGVGELQQEEQQERRGGFQCVR